MACMSVILATAQAGDAISPGWWTIAAVIVAAAAAVFVAWQAFESHRATLVGLKAVAASQAMAVNSARAYLDQDAPRLEVYLFAQWPPLLSSGVGRVPTRVPIATQWRFPDDAAELLTLRASVRIVNLSSGGAKVCFTG